MRTKRLAVLAAVMVLVFGSSGCLAPIAGALPSMGPQIPAETSADIVAGVNEADATATAALEGLRAVEESLAAQGSEFAGALTGIRTTLEAWAPLIQAAAANVNESPLNRRDADGNPLPTDPMHLVIWVVTTLGGIVSALKYGEKRAVAKKAREDQIGRMAPEEYEKVRAAAVTAA